MTPDAAGDTPAGGGPVRHTPVLLPEVMAGLAPKMGETAIDATFGAGGYTKALLSAGARVIALDRDEQAIAAGAKLAADHASRLRLVHAPFSALSDHVPSGSVDMVCFDLGVSSMQLNQAERGFSFVRDGPLDMRMGGSGRSAADLINIADEAELADILYTLGEERRSRAIARAIVRAREAAPITRTSTLAALVEATIGRMPGAKIHPATRTFQALRIAVNDELGELEAGLASAETALCPGGRLAVVAFHSLEDRIVKRFLAEASGRRAAPSRHAPEGEPPPPARFKLPPRQPVTPGRAEESANPRARSARLRCAVKV